MNIKPIKTEQDYQNTLSRIESLMIAKANTPEGDELDVLVTLVEAYERQHYALPLPDPIEVVKFEMERRGLTTKDLVPMIGKPNRVSEVLNRKRGLSLSMIQRLHTMLGIPAEALIGSPSSSAAS